MEQWKPISRYEGIYEVSDAGRIKRIGRCAGGPQARNVIIGRVLATRTNRSGYVLVNLYKQGKMRTFSLHILVAHSFIGPRPLGKETNHKDGDKENCSLDNLEYTTFLENRKHAQEVLNLYRGERQHLSKFTRDQIPLIRNLLKTTSQCEIARRFGVSQPSIWSIAHRITWGWVE
jgi:NUMOD4 motif/HNH endonuclease